MALSDVDIKILWSRAAGLCSFPDCREILIRFSKTDRGFYQIGEMAHLVARSIKGPRGIGPLADDARDSYENHILLCSTCHTEIDKNAADYPVDNLQMFKIQHEHWVAETLHTHLSEKIGFLKFYGDLLRRIENLLDFDHWPWLIDPLWRDLAPASAIDSAIGIRKTLLRTIWPGNQPQLETSLKGVMEVWSKYCENFETSCRYRGDDFMVSDHFQPWMRIEDRLDAEVEQEKWSKRNGELLLEFVERLNGMIDAVRQYLQPDYRQDEGYFLIHDDLGYRNGGRSVIIRPVSFDAREPWQVKRNKDPRKG